MDIETATAMLNDMNVGKIYTDNDVKIQNDMIQVEKSIIESEKNIALKWLDEKFDAQNKIDDDEIVYPFEKDEIIEKFDNDKCVFHQVDDKEIDVIKANDEKVNPIEEIKTIVDEICQKVEEHLDETKKIDSKIEEENFEEKKNNNDDSVDDPDDSWLSFRSKEEEYVPIVGKIYEINEKDHGIR